MLFAHRLALALGQTDPAEMLRGMPRETLSGWLEYNQIEPFGAERDDLRIAILAANLMLAWTGKRIDIDRFMPRFADPDAAKPRQTPEQMHAVMQQFAARAERSLNGSH